MDPLRAHGYETALAVALALTGVRAVAVDIAGSVMDDGGSPASDVLRRTLAGVDEWQRATTDRPASDALGDDLAAARFWSAVRTLSPFDGRVMALGVIAGATTEVIATSLGASVADVVAAGERARAAVAALLGVTGAGSSLRQNQSTDDVDQWAP